MTFLITLLIMTSLFSNQPIWVAHRACDISMPENTLESLKRMEARGCKWFEIDCYLMNDGNIAVIHDEKINRTTTGNGKITKMTLHDLHAIFVTGGDGGEKIPMLPDIMDYAFNHGLHIMIELKGKDLRLVDKVDALIGRYDCDLFRVYSFEEKVIEAFSMKHPCYPIHWNMKKFSDKKLEIAKSLGANINLDGRYVKKSDIEKLLEHGMEVHVYTVNDKERAKELFGFGIHALITDALIKGETSG